MNFDTMKTLLESGLWISEIKVNRFDLEIEVTLKNLFERVTFKRSYLDKQIYVGDLVNLANLIVENVNTKGFGTDNL